MISSKTLVLARSCLLWTVGYYLLTDPVRVFKNPFVVVLGAGVNAKQTYPQEAGVLVPFVGALLALVGLQDLAIDDKSTLYTATSMRVLGVFILCAASYMGRLGLDYSLVFATSFTDLLMSFMVFLTVRDERNEETRIQIRRNRGINDGADTGADGDH